MTSVKQDRRDITVLIVTSSFPRPPLWMDGGFIWTKAVTLREKGISVIVLCPHGNGAPLHEDRDGIIIHRFPYFFPFRAEKLSGGRGLYHATRKNPVTALALVPYTLSCIAHAILLTKKYQPNIIHTHWIIPNGLAGACVNLIFKTPHVTSIHGTDVTISSDNPVLSMMIRIISRFTTSITTNSSFTGKKLSAIIPGYGPFATIPMGIYCEPCTGPEKKVARETDVILFVGRLIDWKGVNILVSSMKKVRDTVRNARLVIVGDGPERKSLADRVKELGLEDSVTFTGQVSDEELKDYYSRASVFVLPSITVNNQTEGLGVVLLEAMASGIPVIGSNTGGIPDIIEDKVNGLLVPPGDPDALAEAIIRIFEDRDLADRFREAGLETVKGRFSWDKISDQFIEVYREVLHESNKV